MKTLVRLLTVAVVIVTMLFLSIGSAAAGAAERHADAMFSWSGADINRVIREWGPPTNVFTSPNGEKTYTWVEVNGQVMTGVVRPELFGSGTHIATASRESSCRRSFIVGTYTGTGILFYQKKKDLVVRASCPDTPVGQAGVQVGDIILAVNGTSTKGMGVQFTESLIIRAKRVTLTVKRKKVKEPLEFVFEPVLLRDRVTGATWQGQCF